jgi:hypothetical protein
MVWRTGPVGNLHRAILRDGTLVAVAESTEEAAVIVRRMNEPVAKVVQEPNTKELQELKAKLRAMCDDSIAHSGITYPLAERIKRELL